MGTVLDTLSALGTAGTGVGAVGSFVTGIVGGILQNRQAEKAQAYNEKWTNKLYQAELNQAAIENKQAQEKLNLSKDAQYFNQQLSLRDEKRKDTDRWHTYMQDSANKYAEALNKSRSLRAANAQALRNR